VTARLGSAPLRLARPWRARPRQAGRPKIHRYPPLRLIQDRLSNGTSFTICIYTKPVTFTSRKISRVMHPFSTPSEIFSTGFHPGFRLAPRLVLSGVESIQHRKPAFYYPTLAHFRHFNLPINQFTLPREIAKLYLMGVFPLILAFFSHILCRQREIQLWALCLVHCALLCPYALNYLTGIASRKKLSSCAGRNLQFAPVIEVFVFSEL